MFYVVSSPKHKHDSQKASSRMVKQILYIHPSANVYRVARNCWVDFESCVFPPPFIPPSLFWLTQFTKVIHTIWTTIAFLRPRFSLRPDHQRKTGQRCLWPLCRGEVVRRKGSRTYIAWYGTDDVIFPLNRHIRNAIGCLICL